jgi:Uma2 family endonuclease
MSFESYLRFVERVEWRYEYVGGFAYAMAGTRRVHNRVNVNLTVALDARMRGGACETYADTFLVRTPAGDAYLPDVMVGCGPTRPDDARFLDDPTLIVEVLSPSTTRMDLGEKRAAYAEIPTLRAYLVVETEWRAVHRHWRDETGAWHSQTITAATGSVSLPFPDAVPLSFDEVYRGVQVPVEPPRARRGHEQLQPADV